MNDLNSDIGSCSDSDDFRQDDYDSLYGNDVSDQYFDEMYESEDYSAELGDVNQEDQTDTSGEDGQGLENPPAKMKLERIGRAMMFVDLEQQGHDNDDEDDSDDPKIGPYVYTRRRHTRRR